MEEQMKLISEVIKEIHWASFYYTKNWLQIGNKKLKWINVAEISIFPVDTRS